ncbi:hypothetical protein HK102_005454 [Quaeritorhiza haematococci]|nr:hypothetical protein HK102_005454 [Quaeritorhiza haematococci]
MPGILTPAAAATPLPPPKPAAQLLQLQDEFVDIYFRLVNPVSAAHYGYTKYQDEIFDASQQNVESCLTHLKSIQDRASSLDLTPEQNLKSDLEFLQTAIEFTLLEFKGQNSEVPLSYLYSCVHYLDVVLQTYQPLETESDIEHYKTRLTKIPSRFDGVIAELRRGVTVGITLPEICIKSLASHCQTQLVDNPTTSPFNRKFESLQLKNDAAFLVPTINSSVIPSYRKLHDFLLNDYIVHARENPGVYGSPNAQSFYENRIYVETSLHHNPADLHDFALHQVQHILSEIDQLKQKIFPNNPSLSLQELRFALSDRVQFPGLHYDFEGGRDGIVKRVREVVERVEGVMTVYFERMPAVGGCEVEPVPEHVESEGLPMLFYEPGSVNRPGTLRINTNLAKKTALTTLTALVLHESNPGHHHQISLAAEEPTSHVIRKVLEVTGNHNGSIPLLDCCNDVVLPF